jgi:hypothetical protein
LPEMRKPGMYRIIKSIGNYNLCAEFEMVAN